MRHQVSWRLMFRVKDRRKALGRIEEVRNALGVDVEVTVCEQYWKIPDLWECSLRTPEIDRSIPKAVFDCLTLANRLGNGWYLLGPLVKDDVLIVFEGVFGVQNSGTPYIAGLDWGSFSIISLQAEEEPNKPLQPTAAP